jgi:RND family efflux transporter MFP subunit
MSTPDLARLSLDRATPAAQLARRRRRRWLRWGIGALVVAALAAAFMIRQAQAPLEVELATVGTAWPSQSFTLLNATGRVTAARKASVSAKATGRLQWLGVQEGSRVKAGEVIARLEALDVQAARDQAEAAKAAARANLAQGKAELADAELNLRRQQELFAKGFVSQAVLDAAESRLARARAAIASLEAAINVSAAQVRSAAISVDQTVIRAPFDGVILTKNANVGDIITPFSSAAGTQGAVVTMADLDTLEVEVDVAEASIGKVTVGAPTEITLDALPEVRLAGSVSRIVPTVDRSKATVLVKVAFVERDPRILPDMSARVAFLSRPPTADERKPVTVVRKEAVRELDGRSVVFRLERGAPDRARAIAIARGRELGDLIEVSGIAPGERIVTKPPAGLRDGQAIRQAGEAGRTAEKK